MMKAADAMLSNVDVARLAMHKSQNPDVRDFANTIQRALHKKSWAVIDRPYSLGCAIVGALYERSRCIFCAKPIQSDDASTLQDLTDRMNDKGVSLPNTLTPEMKAEIETMTALSGAELDRELTNIMVAQHQKEVEMFPDQAE